MKITKSKLQKLIKEELKNTMVNERATDEEVAMMMKLAKVLEPYGYSLSDPFEWLEDGLSKGVVQRIPNR